MSDYKCIVCGNLFPQKTIFKPRIYCGDNCSNHMKYKNALEKSILCIEATSSAKKIIRGDMFRLSNILCKCTNTKADKND